ncbi:hypothetical protein EON83_15410 [bacterium]|nr:MAG: hypothetical protein EON83_15410 [bacterium]
MHSAIKISLCLLLLTVPLQAQTPTDFAGWKAKATELLNAPGEGENEIRRKWDQGTKATEAGKALMEAAKLAPDAAAKFKTLDSAGAAFAKGNGSNREAIEAYQQARDITSAPPEERARVGLEAAKLSFDIADYEKVVAITGASDKQKAQAYVEIGLKSGVVKDFNRAAQSYEMAAKLDKTKANSYLDSASVYAQQMTPVANGEAMLDSVYKAKLKLIDESERTDDEKATSRPYVLANWARDINAIGVSERASTLWQQAADSPKATEQLRYDSLKNAATAAQKSKDYDGAFTLWAKVGKIANDSYLSAQEVALGRSDALLSKGEYTKTRDELGTLLTHPKAGPREKEGILLTQSSLYFDEADALEKKPAPAEQIAASEAEGVKMMDTLWAIPTTSDAAMLQIMVKKTERKLKKKEYVAAHELVSAGITKFTERKLGTEWLQQLHILNGDIYRGEKQYASAMISYSTGIIRQGWDGAALVPNQPIYNAAIGMLSEATEAKKFDEARKVVEWLDKWQVPVDPTVLYKIELEIKAGNKEAARELITKNKPLIAQEESKKKLAELETLAFAN